MRELPSGTVTFLFTDVEGSTKLLHELGEKAYADALARHRRVVRDAFGAQGGVEVDTQGDAFFVAFPTAPAALTAAAAIQEGLASGPIRVRAGLHTGTPLLTDEGYVGHDVHRAARIAAVGHGGQVLLSQATLALADAEVTDLGEHRLKDFPEPVPLFQLGRARFPPLRTISNTNLPRPVSSFVGREREVAEVVALLQEGARLVTLSGPGGCGKTRLALEAASELVTEFKAGVFWVGLAALREPELVLEALAQTLGATDGVRAHIGEREMLLVLDNLEQVIEAAPQLAELLESCPNLKLLVTSRELLRIRGEVEYCLQPLANAEAVELFCVRSRLQADDAIAELCRRLDNLPLAIELAAARARALSPRQILERVGQRLDLLKGGRDADARQQTLRAAIEWSYDLLDEDEQRLFARIAVFRGGCTLEAAEEVADASLDTLQSLVDKSLLRQNKERFWMLETIREYALERLDERALARRHAKWFLTLAEEAEPHLQHDSSEWLARLDEEHDNFRAAVDSFESTGDSSSALRLTAALWRLWDSGNLAEGRLRLERALANAPQPSNARARALNGAAMIMIRAGDAASGRDHAEQARALHHQLGNTHGIAEATFLVGFAHFQLAQFDEAIRCYQESQQLFDELGDNYGALSATRFLAGAAFQLGDFAQVRTLYEELLQRARTLGAPGLEAEALAGLAALNRDEGRLDEANTQLSEALRIHRDDGTTLSIAQDLARFASLRAREGHAAAATRLLAASQALHEEIGAAPSIWLARMNERTLLEVRARLDDATVAHAFDQGTKTALDDAIALALTQPTAAPTNAKDDATTNDAASSERPPEHP